MSLKNLPQAFAYEDEENIYLKSYKRSRYKKWSVKSSASLREMADLAANLLSLDRQEEAAMIGIFVKQSVVFANDSISGVLRQRRFAWVAKRCVDRETSLRHSI